MVDLRLMVANLKFIFLICFQQETLADGIVPTNVNVLLIFLILVFLIPGRGVGLGKIAFEERTFVQ